MKRTNIFDVILIIFMMFICFIMIYPFWSLLMNSFTSPEVSMIQLRLFPEKFSLSSYQKVLSEGAIGKGYINTICRTVLGSTINMVVIVLMAYPLSKKYLPKRSAFTGFVVFTMYFSGGLIPNLGLYDTIWALVLPGAVNVFNLIIVRNFFMSIPSSLEECAKLDGCNEFLILIRIVLPLSKSILATLLLWSAVGHWNSWFDSMVYIKTDSKQVLQTIMRRVIQTTSMQAGGIGTEDIVNPENVKAATIMLSIGPIIAVYPFVQKYFIKGTLVGAVKG